VEAEMNEDTFNMEIRKYLKQVGITSQREIEHAVQKALGNGTLKGSEAVEVKMTLEVTALGVRHCVEGKICLE
jgi:ribosomal protein L1